MQGTTCYTTTLVPPKPISNPSRHFHQRECGPQQKQKQKKQKNKNKKKYAKKPRGEDKAAHLHTQKQREFRHPQNSALSEYTHTNQILTPPSDQN